MTKLKRILVVFKDDVTVWIVGGQFIVEKAGKEIARTNVYTKAIDTLWSNT